MYPWCWELVLSTCWEELAAIEFGVGSKENETRPIPPSPSWHGTDVRPYLRSTVYTPASLPRKAVAVRDGKMAR